ncbi:hypothetical protein [Kitasatospora sp. NPDC098663]|uniref:hypothetical protein n=1 Tax=Kitasatospora sp. NPDC098663 TaxID=3364096 RepID=UPI0037FA47D3
MERVIDLDEVAAKVAARTPGWRAAGLVVGQVTWRDHSAPWTQRFVTDRSLVNDPDSIGVIVSGPAEAELSVVLFRGGWADVDYFDGMDNAGALPASGIASAREFGVRLDGWVARVFGPPSCSGELSLCSGLPRHLSAGAEEGPAPGDRGTPKLLLMEQLWTPHKHQWPLAEAEEGPRLRSS